MNNSDIIKALAKGHNPITGELIPDDSVLSDPIIIRALFSASEAMNSNNKTSESRPTSSQRDHKVDKNIQAGYPKNHGLPWNSRQKAELINKFKNGSSVNELTLFYERTRGAINGVLFSEGLIDKDDLPKALSMEERISQNIELGRPKNYGIHWNENDLNELIKSFKNGSTIKDLSTRFERTEGGIETALADAGLKSEVLYQKRKIKNTSQNLPINHGRPWTKILKEELFDKFSSGTPIPELALQFERTQGSIAATLFDGGLISEEEYESIYGRKRVINEKNDSNIYSKPQIENQTRTDNRVNSEYQEVNEDPNFPFKL